MVQISSQFERFRRSIQLRFAALNDTFSLLTNEIIHTMVLMENISFFVLVLV